MIWRKEGIIFTSMFAEKPDPLSQTSVPKWSLIVRFKNTASGSSSRIKKLIQSYLQECVYWQPGFAQPTWEDNKEARPVFTLGTSFTLINIVVVSFTPKTTNLMYSTVILCGVKEKFFLPSCWKTLWQ